MRPIRAHLPEMVLVVVAICVSLALAEGFVRLFYPHVRDHAVPGRLFEIDEQLGWTLRPGASAIHASRYFQAPYSINAFGYRDGVRRTVKDGTTRRILLYGDSQVFGWGLPEAQRFSNLIEARSAGVEIWNLAVPGYGLDQEILSYERDGQRFHANEIVLLVSVSTINRLPYDYVYRKNKPKFVLDSNGGLQLVPIRQGANAWTSFLYDALSGFYLPYFVEYQLAAAKKAAPEVRAADRAAPQAPKLDPGRLELSLLERAHGVALSRGHQLTLLVDLPQSLEAVKRRVGNFCAEKAIRCLEIALPPAKEQFVFGVYDGHWNPSANAMIAEQLLVQLQTRAATPPTAPAGAQR